MASLVFDRLMANRGMTFEIDRYSPLSSWRHQLLKIALDLQEARETVLTWKNASKERIRVLGLEGEYWQSPVPRLKWSEQSAWL